MVATGKPAVVLLRNGRALALKGGVRKADALVVTWFLGSQTGPAIADVLYGDVNPSGRLPVSFPQTPGQVPYYYSHKRTGRPLLADAPAQMYRARYLDTTNDALYPFGYGIGYARIRYDTLALESARMPWDGPLRVHARITNTGAREAEEVVQLYVGARSASVTRPVRELKGFRKVRVGPGQSRDVDFTLTRADLMFIGQDLKPTVEPGTFDLWVGPSATQGLRSSFVLAAE